MKKSFKLLFAALFALAAVVPAKAETLTVFDDVATNESSPIYGYYMDTQNYIVQTILPAEDLTVMQGAFITSMKFYVSGEDGNLINGGKVAISLGTTNQTAFSSYSSPVEVTQVAEVVMTLGETEVVVNFDTPYNYEGGNLVIESKVIETANYPHNYFLGKASEVTNVLLKSNYTTSTDGFYPKTTFTYEVFEYLAAVSANELAFGQLYLEEEATKSFTLKNIGKNAFTPVFSALTAPFSITPAAAEIAPGESVEYSVKFAPTAVGEFAQTLSIDCGAAGNFEVALTGVGAEMPAEVVVAEGTSTNSYVPVYGYSYDGTGGLGQMIYPESMLTELVGKKINALKFHHDLPYSKMNGGNIQLSMKVVEDGAFASATAITDMTVVANGSPVAGETEIVFTFNEPFLYNGGNLAVEALVTEAGSYGSDKFYGVALDGASYGYYNDFGWESNVFNFLPMATFGYVKEEGGQEDGITLLSEANALEDAAEFTFDGDAVVTAFKNGYLFLRDESGYGMISGVEGAFENGQVLNQGWNATKTSNDGWVSYTNAAGLSASGETNAELAAAQKLTAFPEESMLNAYVYVEKVNKGFFPLRSLTLPDGNTITIASYPWAVNQPASSGDWNAYGVIVKNNGVLEFALVEWEKYVEPEPEYLRGDVNRDKVVNIADVTALIDMLLNGDAMIPEADCNLDNAMNIADVTALIDYLLSGQW